MVDEKINIASIAARADKEQECFMLLNNNTHKDGFPLQLALGKQSQTQKENFEALSEYLKENPAKKLFGYFNYNLKNQLEKLNTSKKQTIAFKDLYFFHPTSILKGEELFNYANKKHSIRKSSSILLKTKTDKKQYINTVQKIKKHIIEGDVYEINFCIEFFAENVSIDPATCYENLINFSPTPFSVLLKDWHKYMIGASPERFMCKRGNKIISQPIKGTSRRYKNKQEDETSKLTLLNSEKERAENLMIVDLVRNDLARSCKLGTIKVDKLFEVQSFTQVHQLVSTISAEVEEHTSPVEVIKNAFPMGSMTGAPKIKAMELIDQYEAQARGLFSGSVGYFGADGDFDFNVVIRSIFYDKKTKQLAFSVGSAITYDSDPEKEYEECLLKAEAIQQVLSLK